MNRLDFFQKQLDLINTFFSGIDLQKLDKKHPLLRKIELCNKLISQNGVIRFPEDFSELGDIAKIMLDSSIWSKISGGNVQNIFIGDFESYGNEEVKKMIYSEMKDPKKYGDVMTELMYGGWSLMQGFNVEPLQEKSKPDFIIRRNDLDRPLIVECKRIRRETNIELRFNSILKKANRQIKNLKQVGYGLVVLDVSEKVPFIQRGDLLPEEIEKFKSIIDRILASKNRSISGVLLIWDDYLQFGIPPEKVLYAIRRHSHFVGHKRARELFDKEIKHLGYCVVFTQYFRPRLIKQKAHSKSGQ